MVVGHNFRVVEAHNFVGVVERRNRVAVGEDSHAAAPGQGKTTWRLVNRAGE